MTTLPRRAAAELIGTAFLVMAVVGSGIMAQRLAGGNEALALLCNTLPTGAILVVLITAFASISGAHFNPVVSLVFAIRHSLRWPDFTAYAVCQLAGGLLGTLLAHAMFDVPLWQISQTVRAGGGQWLAEGMATFGLVLTILLCARASATSVPYAVGLYITAAYWFTSSTSFANPAVTVARAFTDTFAGIAPGGIAAFIAVQFAGGIAALLAANWLLREPGAVA